MSDLELGALTVEGFCDVLASDSPTPGGGAVGAIEGAYAAALIGMVGRLTIGKAGFEDLDQRMKDMVASADAARAEFLVLADRDAHAFDSVMVGFKMPKETDEEKAARSAAIQAGYLAARVGAPGGRAESGRPDGTGRRRHGDGEPPSGLRRAVVRCFAVLAPPSVPSRTSRSTRRR